MENIYEKKQGVFFTGLPDTEKVIIAWHRAIENHKIAIDTELCNDLFVSGGNQGDTLSLTNINNASVGGEISIKMNYYAAETGRSTTTGINIQGLKKNLVRKIIIPHKGNVFVKVDSKSIEPRCLAFLAKEKKLLDIFLQGGDVYTEFGKKRGLGREYGKEGFLACMYGQGVKGIKNALKQAGKPVSYYEAKNIHDGFIRDYPAITGGFDKKGGIWQRAFAEVIQDSTLKLPSGRHINYNPVYVGKGEYGDKFVNVDERKHQSNLWFGRTVNNLVQGTARDVFFWQVSIMWLMLKGKADLCWTVHDDAVFECPESECENVKEVLLAASKRSPPWCDIEGLFAGEVVTGYNYFEIS